MCETRHTGREGFTLRITKIRKDRVLTINSNNYLRGDVEKLISTSLFFATLCKVRLRRCIAVQKNETIQEITRVRSRNLICFNSDKSFARDGGVFEFNDHVKETSAQ